MLAGAYHFLYPASIVSVRAQADLFMAQIGDPDGILAVLDVESDSGGASRPMISDVRAFFDRWRSRHPEHPLFIYTGGWYWRGHMGNPDGSAFGPLWASHYVDPVSTSIKTLFSQVKPSWWTPGFGGWDEVTLLQFSSSAQVSGIGRCDVNAFRGTLAQLGRYATHLPDSATEPDVRTISSPINALPVLIELKKTGGPYGYLELVTWLRGLPGAIKPVTAEQFGRRWAMPTELSEGIDVAGGDGPERRLGFLTTGDLGTFVLAANVDPVTPPDSSPYTQADLDAARLAGLAEGSVVTQEQLINARAAGRESFRADVLNIP
jgi:hypothetical protein